MIRRERPHVVVKEEALRKFMTNGTAAVALIVGMSASAAEPSAFLGAWLISSSQPAPWVASREPSVQSDISGLVGKRVVFAAKPY